MKRDILIIAMIPALLMVPKAAQAIDTWYECQRPNGSRYANLNRLCDDIGDKFLNTYLKPPANAVYESPQSQCRRMEKEYQEILAILKKAKADYARDPQLNEYKRLRKEMNCSFTAY